MCMHRTAHAGKRKRERGGGRERERKKGGGKREREASRKREGTHTNTHTHKHRVCAYRVLSQRMRAGIEGPLGTLHKFSDVLLATLAARAEQSQP